MNAPPKLPQSAKRPSRAFLITIGLVLVIGVPLAVWRVIGRQQELNDVRRMAMEIAVRNNFRQIAASADQFFLENKVKTVKLEQLVGPGKYMTRLTPVDGEDYGALDLTHGVSPWKIVTASGITVTHIR